MNNLLSYNSIPFIVRELLTGFFTPFLSKFWPFSYYKCYWEYQKNLCQPAQIRGVWSLGRKQNSHIRPIFYPITIVVEIYLRSSEAYGHTKKNQNLTRCSGLKSKSAAPKVCQIRLSFYPISIINQILAVSLHTYRKLENTAVSPISGHLWCKKISLPIGGVCFFESLATLVLNSKI